MFVQNTIYRVFLATALILISSHYSYAQKDSLATLAAIPGADMTFYDLYVHQMQDDEDKAIENAILFVKGIDSTAPHPVIARMCDQISNYMEEHEYKYSEAIKWKEKALRIYTELKDDEKKSISKYNLARLYYLAGKYHKTLQLTISALEDFKEDSSSEEKLECYNLLGIVYYICRDYKTSNEYFQKYVAGAREMNDSLKLIRGLYNLSVYTNDIRDTTKTDNLIAESIALTRKAGQKGPIIKVYLSSAATKLEMGQTMQAQAYLDTAYKYIEGPELLGLYHYYKSVAMYQDGKPYKSLTHLDSAITVYGEGEFPEARQRCYQLADAIYNELGDTTKAYKALRNYYSIDKELAKTDVFLELFKAENTIAQHQAQEIETNRRNWHRIIILSLFFIIIIISLIIYIFLRKKSDKIRQKENEVLTRQLINEKNEQEIRVKNEILEFEKVQQYKEDKMIEEIIMKLGKLSSESKDASIRNKIQRICRELESSKEEEHWKELRQFVPEFNSPFFQNLLKEFPDLTINEKRLCAFLNKNLTTKEISEITRQSPQSINTARGRLRNKLRLTGSDISIQEFLQRFN